jgi:hypothetical protein
MSCQHLFYPGPVHENTFNSSASIKIKVFRLKNVISKSFEIQDYMLDGALVNGFWMTLEDRENLTTEVAYSPVSGRTFAPAATERMIREITARCDRLKSLLPENINCEVTFKDFNDMVYAANGKHLHIEAVEMDEIRVVYRLCVEYYI